MYSSDISTFKTTCQHAQKSGGGYPVNCATNAQVTPVTRNKINTLRSQLWQFTQSSLQKVVQTSENQPFLPFWHIQG